MKLRSSSRNASPAKSTRSTPNRRRAKSSPIPSKLSLVPQPPRKASVVESSDSNNESESDAPQTPSRTKFNKEGREHVSNFPSDEPLKKFAFDRGVKSPYKPKLVTYSERKRLGKLSRSLSYADSNTLPESSTPSRQRSEKSIASPKSTFGSRKLDFTALDGPASDDELLLRGSPRKDVAETTSLKRRRSSRYRSVHQSALTSQEEFNSSTRPSSSSSRVDINATEDVAMDDDNSADDDKTDAFLGGSSSLTDFTEAEQSDDYATDDPLSDRHSIFTEDEELSTDLDVMQQDEMQVDEDLGPNDGLPQTIPSHLRDAFLSQKLAILSSLRTPPYPDCNMEDRSKSKDVLTKLLNASIERGEGNSCLVLGPKGCGKTRVCVSELRVLI